MRRQPLLMTADNPDGWKLDALCHQLEVEVIRKSARIMHDKRAQVRAVLRNNEVIIALLGQIAALQRASMDRLEELGPNEGPRGTPRAGPGSAVET